MAFLETEGGSRRRHNRRLARHATGFDPLANAYTPEQAARIRAYTARKAAAKAAAAAAAGSA